MVFGNVMIMSSKQIMEIVKSLTTIRTFLNEIIWTLTQSAKRMDKYGKLR